LLATDLPQTEVKKILSGMPAREQNRRLAFEITKLYHGEKLAQQAQNDYAKMANNQLPENLETVKVKPGNYNLPQLVVAAGLAASGSEARRLVTQGGVKLNGKATKDEKHQVDIKGKDGLVLQVGKRKIVKIV
jgi:tyrosyl-tRNA synthetase